MQHKSFFKPSGILAIIVTSVLLTSCRKDQLFPTFNDQGNIGSDGGIVKTSDGASVEIPAGALSTNKTISITNITKQDTTINTGYKVYELKPDGQIFSEDVIITLPFDGTYIDNDNKLENYGVSVMVFQDNGWEKLDVEIDLVNKTVKVNTNHFSKYVVAFPGEWKQYYQNNKNGSVNPLPVPYYYQSPTEWCAFFSTSMVTRYAGYIFKGPYYASLMSKQTDQSLSFSLPLTSPEFETFLTKINGLGIVTQCGIWYYAENLFGYLINQLKNGQPIFLGTQTQHHAFVVTGYNSDGFYINDPSGIFINETIGLSSSDDIYNLARVQISFEKFKNALQKWFENTELTILPEYSMIVKSHGSLVPNGYSIDFPDDLSSFRVYNPSNLVQGELINDGSSGYFIKNKTSSNNTFGGSDYVHINPRFSNTTTIGINCKIEYKIDGNSVNGSPKSFYIEANKTNIAGDNAMIDIYLRNLSSDYHTLSVELWSNDLTVLYDKCAFEIKIDNGNPPNIPTILSPSDGVSGISILPILSWDCSDPDGDPLTYDVYFGTNSSSLPIVSPDHTTKTYTPSSSLINGTTYFWKVVAKDNHGNSTSSGDPWRFTTIQNLPIPVYQSSIIENATPSLLGITYDLTLANIVPSTSAFVVQVNSVNRTVNSIAISGTKVILTLASPVILGDVVTVAYNKPAINPLQTASGEQAESITAQQVTNNVSAIEVTGITVSGAGGATSITTDNGTLQLSASILPVNATNKTVTWSITSGTDKASINSTGLVTALDNGTATASATANDGSGVSGTLVITITNQVGSGTGIIFNPNKTYGSVSDIDGNTYKTIVIGTQTWMAENLKTTKYNDGSVIPLVIVPDWLYCSHPAYFWYKDDKLIYGSTYGALYNWLVVSPTSNGGKNVCPSGWSVPTLYDWNILINSLGGKSIAGDKLKETGTVHWSNPKTVATNESGFTALPGGIYAGYGTDFMGIKGMWWSSTEIFGTVSSILLWIWDSNANVTNSDKLSGQSIRCIKN